MICPKCGKDVGEVKFCPECGENLVVFQGKTESEQITNPKEMDKKPKKNGKKILLIFAILVVIGGFFGIRGALKGVKKEAAEAPATYVDWSTIYHDYMDNGQTAEEKYAVQKNLFFIYITQIGSTSATVTFYDQNWDSPKVPFLNKNFCKVYFNDYSEIHTGHYYVVEGNIDLLWIDSNNKITHVHVKNANVACERM